MDLHEPDYGIQQCLHGYARITEGKEIHIFVTYFTTVRVSELPPEENTL